MQINEETCKSMPLTVITQKSGHIKLTVKRDGTRRLILALLSPKDLRLRGIAPRSDGGLHARQEPPGCGRVGEHAAQIGVHHTGRRLLDLPCFPLLRILFVVFLSPSLIHVLIGTRPGKN